MRIFNCIISLLILFSAQSINAASSNTKLKIGVIFRLHDQYNTFPKHMLHSMKFALSYLNLTEKFVLLPISHDGSPESLKKAVFSLRKKNVKIFVGGETSSDAILIAKFLPKEDVLLISPTGSSHKIYESNPNAYRMMLDGNRMKFLVREAVKHENCSLLGVIHNVSKPNADYISNTIVKDKVLAKVSDVTSVKVLADEKRFEEKVLKFKKMGVRCVTLFSFESDLRKFVSFMKKTNYNPVIIGGDGWGSNENVVANYSSTVKDFRAYRSMYWNENNNNEFSKRVKEGFFKFTGKKMNAFTAIAFDTIKLLDEITAKGKKQSIDNLHKKLRSNTFLNFLTTDSLRFDSMGSPLKDLHSYKIDKSQSSYWKSIKLEK